MSRSARRTLRILETVGTAERPLGVSEIARRLALPPGTAFRGLDALQRSSYVERYRESSRYILGAAARNLHRGVFAQFKIRDVALAYLRQLASSSGETASLIVPIGWYGVRIASMRGSNEVTNAPSLGRVGALGESYVSRPLLAFQSEETIGRYLAWAEARAGKTIAAELDAIRADGYAYERTDFAKDRAAVVLPICHKQRAIAAIALEGPVLDTARAERIIPSGWTDIVRAVEMRVRAQPQLFENPFGHLDPDGIVLDIT